MVEKVLSLLLLLLGLTCHQIYGHSYHFGICPSVKPMENFDMKQVSKKPFFFFFFFFIHSIEFFFSESFFNKGFDFYHIKSLLEISRKNKKNSHRSMKNGGNPHRFFFVFGSDKNLLSCLHINFFFFFVLICYQCQFLRFENQN